MVTGSVIMPGLGPLDQVDLVGLVVDREVAVQHADAALAGHRDGHPRLGDGVHRGGQQRDAAPRSRGSAATWCRPRTGMTSVSPGSSRTSSKVRPRGATARLRGVVVAEARHPFMLRRASAGRSPCEDVSVASTADVLTLDRGECAAFVEPPPLDPPLPAAAGRGGRVRIGSRDRGRLDGRARPCAARCRSAFPPGVVVGFAVVPLRRSAADGSAWCDGSRGSTA